MSNTPSARQAAFFASQEILYKHKDLQAVLNTTIEKDKYSKAEKNLLTELLYGYFRYKGRIDFLLSQFLQNHKKLPCGLTILLGLASYEILFLRIPQHASVDQAVRLCKKYFYRYTRLTNAVLRRICELPFEGKDENLYRKDNPETAVFLSRYYSCPLWIVKYLQENFSQTDTTTLLTAFLQKPPTGLRLRTNCPTNLTNGKQKLLAEKSGLLSRQSLAAQETLLALEPDNFPEPIWDACCGRGGKSFFLAERNLQILASDTNKKRLIGLQTEQKRLNIFFPIFAADAAARTCLKQTPPTIILDVPCSGLGVLSRRPDSKWKRQAKDIFDLHELQQKILLTNAETLPAGGNLIYITCTLGKKENSQQIKNFLQTKKDFYLAQEYQTPINSVLYEFFYAAKLVKK